MSLARRNSTFLVYGCIFVRGCMLNLRGRMLRRSRRLKFTRVQPRGWCFNAFWIPNCKSSIQQILKHALSETLGGPEYELIVMFPSFVQSVPFQRVQDEYPTRIFGSSCLQSRCHCRTVCQRCHESIRTRTTMRQCCRRSPALPRNARKIRTASKANL